MATAHAAQGTRREAVRRRSESDERGRAGDFKAKLAATKARLERYALFRILESTARGFQKDRLTSHAAAMTYYGIFSLFPLILLFMSLAGLALQSNEQAREQIMALVVGLLPQGQEQLKQVVAGVIDAKGVAAGVGILTLLWSALGWFQVIDNNVNQIWGVDKPRPFVKGKLFALAMVAAIGGVALASWVATAAISLLSAFTNLIPGSALLWQAVVSLVSVLAIAAGFLVLYRFAPQRRVALADVWPAALVTALAWEATRRLLAFYLEKNNMISGYGPIGAAMALLFWIYVASIIILMGAELAYAIAKERRRLGPEQQMLVIAPPGEQPTPKFAPQVGRGFDVTRPDESSPDGTRAMAGSSHALDGQGRSGSRSASPVLGDGRPSDRLWQQPALQEYAASRAGEDPGFLKKLLWAGLTSAMLALAGLLARRVTSGAWEAATHEPPPTAEV